MAKPNHHLLVLILLLSLFYSSKQLQPSQYETLLKIQKLLNHPPFLSSFNNSTSTDLCNIEPTPSLTIVCYQDNLTQLHILGNNNNGGGTNGIQKNVSSDSFFNTLVVLPSLKVLSLVSLPLWGPLPESIGQLPSLEILNLTSNYLSGTIPVQLSFLTNLQTLVIDHNNFNGSIPGWLSSLQNLSVLSLKNNSLSGVLPNSLNDLQTLRVVSLSSNHLSGEVPDLQNLTNLQVLDLQDNYFGPHFPSFQLHNKLVTLVLKNNRFQFGIPNELGSYHQLQKLDISLNGFMGPFLPSLLSLPSITHLDIHGNKLSGMLFKNMSCSSTTLDYVDLSSNLFTGDLPTCLLQRVVLYSRNCLSNQEKVQNPSKFCHNEALAVKITPHDKQKSSKTPCPKSVLASSMVGGTVGGIAFLGIGLLVVRKFRDKNRVKAPSTKLTMENVSTFNTVKLLSDASSFFFSAALFLCYYDHRFCFINFFEEYRIAGDISRTMKLGASLPVYRTFALEELKEATNNFDASSLMSEGSHGQMYRGKLNDGTLVAIRSLRMRKGHNSQIYTHHIELISKLRHSHLASALGHCLAYDTDASSVSIIYLIFEFVPYGTLRSSKGDKVISHLALYFLDLSATSWLTFNLAKGFSGPKLTWIQRIAAAIGVARGIQFLHTGIVPGVFSNNIKITDVLLDQNLHVKLRTYNLPLVADSMGMGNAGVSFPGSKAIFLTRMQNEDKSDVYDIGVILLEIITGRPIMSQNEVFVAKDLLQVSITKDDAARKSIVDPEVRNECSDESLKRMMELCVMCLSNQPTHRPSIEDILWNLQFATQVQNSTHNNNQEQV
ncbi:hypothetical protein Ddye_029277 [Dipteronia dyeriana]|uniref:Protein kinase domain-containing protein n=1 Tax=Dipteronia dyeriana TaxID=168575 RepID=A0AAD9WLJ3_9ROSI|nr:hypothetical protein Ddye_029277 [Dipteronia dyeriana]